MKKELIPLKKNLRGLYEAKQECDDTTVHMKVSINTEIHSTFGSPWLKLRCALLVCKHVSRNSKKCLFLGFLMLFGAEQSGLWCLEVTV